MLAVQDDESSWIFLNHDGKMHPIRSKEDASEIAVHYDISEEDRYIILNAVNHHILLKDSPKKLQKCGV